MNILFLTHYFPPEGNAPASRVYEMTRRWVRKGHEVTVLTGVPNVPMGIVYEGYQNRWVQRETIEGIAVIRVWTWLAANKGTLRRTLNYVSFMLSAVWHGLWLPKPDVIVATSPQFFCGWAGRCLSRLRRVPFVSEIRDIWPDSIVAVGAMQSLWMIRFMERQELRLYRSARHIVTVGEGYQAHIAGRGIPTERITVIHNGVDPARFQPRPPDEAIRAEYGLASRFVCSYVGTIGMACGLEVVLRAARILKGRGLDRIVFMLIGDGAVRHELEESARAQGLDNIVFTGLQPKARIPALLSITDACLVHLKKTDPFRYVLPSKIYEAAAMARPVILGVEGLAKELVENAGAGLCIEPENELQLVDALERLSGDPTLARDLGAAGLKNIAPRFNCDLLADAYLDVLSRVVSLPPAV